MAVQLDESVAVMGPGAGRVIEAIARLRRPTGGDIRFGDARLATMPNAVFGRHIAYIGESVYLRGPTLFDTLAYALKSAPASGAALLPAQAKEAARSGNPLDDPAADWIDYARAGVGDMAALRLAMLEMLAVVEMNDDVYSWGLREPVRADGGMEDSILRARRAVAERLASEGLDALVEGFDAGRVNANATIAENLLFGVGINVSFQQKQLPKNETVLAALREAGAFEPLVEAGRSIATTLVEIFEDLSADNPLMERYSFVDAAEMPAIRGILDRASLTDADREALLALAFGYIDVRHRLGVLDEPLRARIVAARDVLRRMIEADDEKRVAFYSPDEVTPGAPLVDDILFGRIANDIARARERVEAVVFEVLDVEGLLTVVRIAGLNHEIGPGGRRLSASQRQRIGLARALLRRPDVLLLNEPMVVIDEGLGERMLSLRQGKATYAALARPQYADLFGRRIWFEDGRLKSDETDGGAPAEAPPADMGLDTEVAALERVPLFAGLEPAKLKLIALSSERMIFAAGEDLFRQGDSADHAYVIIAGAAEILIDGPEGETRIATVEKNHFVGELALLSAQSRSATVRATHDLTALAITKDTFFQMIEDFPQISIRMMRDLGERLLDTNDKLAEARSNGGRES
jgi:ABC-type sugar transport system ATPase subunit